MRNEGTNVAMDMPIGENFTAKEEKICVICHHVMKEMVHPCSIPQVNTKRSTRATVAVSWDILPCSCAKGQDRRLAASELVRSY